MALVEILADLCSLNPNGVTLRTISRVRTVKKVLVIAPPFDQFMYYNGAKLRINKAPFTVSAASKIIFSP